MIPRNKFGMKIVAGVCVDTQDWLCHLFCVVFINSFDKCVFFFLLLLIIRSCVIWENMNCFDIIYVPFQCWKELYLNFPFRIGLRCVAPACILLRLQLKLLLRASLFRMPPTQVLASFPSRLFTFLTGLDWLNWSHTTLCSWNLYWKTSQKLRLLVPDDLRDIWVLYYSSKE